MHLRVSSFFACLHLGLTRVGSRWHPGRRWMRSVFQQLHKHAAAVGYDAQAAEYEAVLRWFELIVAAV